MQREEEDEKGRRRRKRMRWKKRLSTLAVVGVCVFVLVCEDVNESNSLISIIYRPCFDRQFNDDAKEEKV